VRGFSSLAIAVAVYAGLTLAAAAAELILIEYNRCGYCIRFNATVGKHYAESPQARIAPLRRFELGGKKAIPADLRDVRIRGTPTFILRDGGREIGRFDGFRDPDRFWAQLDALIAKMH
jgi:thioredoxin-related protein